MSQSADHSKNYTTADIQQYLDGKMDAAEMHAFEKALMDDPFLADAMEGLQETNLQFGKETFTTELHQLEKQLETRISSEKSTPVAPISGFKWWKVAAAAVVIIVAGVFAFNSFFSPSEKEDSTIALNDDKVTTAPALNKTTDSLIDRYDTVARGTEKVPPNISTDDYKETESKLSDSKKSFETDKNKNTINAEISQDASAPSTASSKSIAAQKDEVAVLKKESAPVVVKADSVDADIASRSAEKQRDVEARQKAAPQINGYSKSKGISNTYKGLLISPDNKPVANANLLINQNEKANTDAKGYFNFSNKDSQVYVTVSSPGFKERNFTLKNNYAFNELQIEPAGNALNETVVINKKAAKERSNAFINYPKVMVQDAEPVNGWVDFENYIEANRKNIQHLDSKTGEVVISFIVNGEGKLSSFKIEQPLTDAQDEEALRLIKSGPAWHLLKGKKARAVVIIRF